MATRREAEDALKRMDSLPLSAIPSYAYTLAEVVRRALDLTETPSRHAPETAGWIGLVFDPEEARDER